LITNEDILVSLLVHPANYATKDVSSPSRKGDRTYHKEHSSDEVGALYASLNSKLIIDKGFKQEYTTTPCNPPPMNMKNGEYAGTHQRASWLGSHEHRDHRFGSHTGR